MKYALSQAENSAVTVAKSQQMALTTTNILEELHLNGQTNDLLAALHATREDLQQYSQLGSIVSRIGTILQGLTDWQASLIDFGGAPEQASSARRQRPAASGHLAEINSHLNNLTEKLAEGDNDLLNSEYLREDVINLDQEVRNLIDLFPGATPRRMQRNAQVLSDPVPQDAPVTQSFRGTQPSRETSATGSATNFTTTRYPYSSPSPTPSYPARQTSAPNRVYQRVCSINSSRMIVGSYYAPHAVADSENFPQFSNDEYRYIEAKDNSFMLVGDAIGGNPFDPAGRPAQGPRRRGTDRAAQR